MTISTKNYFLIAHHQIGFIEFPTFMTGKLRRRKREVKLIPILLKERSVNKTKKEEGWKSRGGNVNRRFSPFFVEVHKKICFPSFLLTYIIPSRKERIRFTSLFLHLSSFFLSEISFCGEKIEEENNSHFAQNTVKRKQKLSKWIILK